MAFNFVESVSSLFNNDLIRNAANSLGENEGGIQKAIGGIIPSVLTGLLNKAGSGTGSVAGILNMAKEAAGSGILSNLGNLLGNNSNSGGNMTGLLSMAGSLFGDKLGSITNLISGFAGIKSSSASSLISMAAPAALGALGKYASSNNLNTGGLLSFLSSQKDNILSAVPSGLGLASALGIGSLGDIGSKLSDMASNVAGEAKKGMNKIVPILLVLAAIVIIWLLMRGCGGQKAEDTPPTDTTTIAPVTVDTPVEPKEVSFKVKLPDATELDALKGGIEDQLVTFLNDSSSKLSKDKWFDFDNLNFETGSAKITAESQQQINNIVAILKAFPKAKIKIGGYTDKTGDDAGNKKLSQERADAVLASLKSSGAAAGQLDGAEGYGSAFAKVAATASEEERKKDRRIAVSVRAK